MQISIWEKESFYAPKDVIIIGSGFTGLWSAYELFKQNEKLKICILERGIIPTGASTRNAGFSCFGSPTELIADAATMGEEKMWRLVDMRYRGLKKIRDHFSESTIDYYPCGGFECLNPESPEAAECSEKLDWLNSGLAEITGKHRVFSFADQKLQEFGLAGFGHLIENPLEAGLHPGRMVQALLQKLQSFGIQIMTGMDVEGLEEAGDYVTVYTKQGVSLRSTQLLLCTNAFTPSLWPEADIVPARGQVLVTAPIPNLRLRGTFHYDHGFYYFRNLGNRLVLGGARNKAFEAEQTTNIETSDLIQRELEDFMVRHILPDTSFSVECRWAGTMAMGGEKMPIVKQLSNRTYCCARMSGMGVALAPIVADQIATLMNQ